jgi:RimJ/RimL family protein N-acetyltransferase
MIVAKNFNIRHVTKTDLGVLSSLINDLTLRGDYLPVNIMSAAKLEQTFNETSLSTEDRETLLIVDKQGEILGTFTHFKSAPYFNAIEIGYHLFSQSHRRSGVTTEAVGLVTSYLFETKPVNRLEIRLDVRNIASERVAVKCGYRHEGIARGANFVRGRFVDMSVYALLRHEWESRM